MAEGAEPAARPPCTHPDAWLEYKIHLNELVCKCGARRDANPGGAWYRPTGAIDHREPDDLRQSDR